MNYHAYLGTNSFRESKGIYHIVLDSETQTIQVKHTSQALNADYICFSPDEQTLYAALEVVYYAGKPNAAVKAYRIKPDGALTELNERSVDGQMACFCSTRQDGALLSSSYMGGSVTIVPTDAAGVLLQESAVIHQPVREGYHWPSVHSVYETPDQRYIFSTNVGLDRVFLHRKTEKSWTQVWEQEVKGRPRQAAFSADGRFIYVSTEYSGEVYVLAYDGEGNEKLRTIQQISTTPAGWSGHAETAGIKLSPDGRMLVVANRAMELNDLALFSVDSATGVLSFAGRVAVHGVFPRDFDFTPDSRYLLAGLQFSDNLELFEADTANAALASQRADFVLPCCSCVKFLRKRSIMK